MTLAPPEPQRLSKVVAALRGCSRSEAEQYIAEGWVRVDGRTVEAPQERVAPGQRVEIDPAARLQPPLPATFLLHKPAGLDMARAQALLAPGSRWSGDACGIRYLQRHAAQLATLLPLPASAAGLCVFSQDRRIVRKLTEEARDVEQEFNVEVTGTLAEGGLQRLAAAAVLRGQPLPALRVSWQSEARLRFAGKGIAPETLAWRCEQAGLAVAQVKRIRVGRIAMAGLPAGQWRYLPPGERF